MNVGISVPLPAYLVDVGFMARDVEELGFESFWCAEHPFIPVRSASRFPGSADGAIPETYSHFIDPFVALARASGVTSRIKLGTGIVLVPERHPLLLAKEVSTLDLFSGGRFLFGIGAGWLREETEIMGARYATRWQRMREMTEAMRLLWTEERVDFEGRFYSTQKATIYDRPDEPVPLYVAASGPLAAKLAGRVGDGFICTSGKDPALYEELLGKVAEGAAEAGREPGGIRRMIEVKVSYDRDRDRAFENTHPWAALALTPEQKEGIEDPIEMERVADANLDQAPSRFICSDDPEEVVERIAGYAELGFDDLVLHAPGTDQRRFLEQFCQDVLPILRDRL